jgi:UDP-N-acetylglucosamine 2-epimerase (non-hydrolysing)
MKKMLLVVGARPNFVKAAAVIGALKETGVFDFKLVHTGQHYDPKMSQAFFEDLQMSPPDVNLDIPPVGYEDLGMMMKAFSLYLTESDPDVVMVFGDVASTLACALVAKYSHYPLAHVEAGCRSFDRTMPEEVNRVVVDTLSDYCFCNTEQDAANLIREGKGIHQIFVVGNTMVDTLLKRLPEVEKLWAPEDPYVLATFHRPFNVDDTENLTVILDQLKELSKEIHVVFPVHPRTRKRIFADVRTQTSLSPEVVWMELRPLRYLSFLAHLKKAELVITDSGGVQVEAAVLGTRCLTVRGSTEHSWTLGIGGNTLIKREEIYREARGKLQEPRPFCFSDELSDGRAAHRIVSTLITDGR